MELARGLCREGAAFAPSWPLPFSERALLPEHHYGARRPPLCVPLMVSPSSLVNATNGTILLYTFERATLIEPSGFCCFTIFNMTCWPGGPTGITMMPFP